MSRRIRIGVAAGVMSLAVAAGVATASAAAPDTSVGGTNLGDSGKGSADAGYRPGVHRDGLVRPQHVVVDPGLSPARSRLVLLRIRELYTFWDTGDVRYLRRADSPAFVDHTLPAGRPQGLAGIEEASKTFRAAVPDLHCTVADVLVSGDRVSVRQIYTGHFTGTYAGRKGHGQAVRFIAFDIQQVGKSQIVGDWHLEDNLTFLKQIGAVS